MSKKEPSVTLYLTAWQKRMIKDCASAKDLKVSSIDRLIKVKVAFIDKKQWVMYRQPVEAFKAGQWNLYLTDEQIHLVADATGMRAKFSALNVSPELVNTGAIAFG
jgi:hypothetical protein